MPSTIRYSRRRYARVREAGPNFFDEKHDVLSHNLQVRRHGVLRCDGVVGGDWSTSATARVVRGFVFARARRLGTPPRTSKPACAFVFEG